MAKGNIGVTSDNIFPVIKKFLYSDHEIFLRELVSNAVDATQKLKTLSAVNEFKGEIGESKVRVSIQPSKGTITISDNGIGMTAEEVDKYINQIAFSGAEEFVNKYKDNAQAIIGLFGLVFYSAFMVAKKVEIFTQSYKEEAAAVHWSCDGSPEYTMEETIKSERGTDIILHIDDECKEFLEETKIEGLLKKYCKFLPVEIAFGKKKEWKDGKQIETEEDNIINNPQPAWTKKPAEFTEDDYKTFYHELYPMSMDEPLFHIHLNVDYPFNLTGILYFPKIKPNMDLHKNKIQLYCNQVFVTDSVENIVPEYLTLLHGVIDSPDIPLNVSRSYLQSDGNVKKISGHITKKVADRLSEIFKNDRTQFEEKWEDIKLFIQYGMLSDEKFYERAAGYALLRNVDKKYFTYEEYKQLIEENQRDKEGQLIYLYANDTDAQYAHIERAKEKGYDVLLMDSQLDVHIISQIEQKNEKTRFVRVDSDIVENLIKKENEQKVEFTQEQLSALESIFSSQLPKMEKTNFIVGFEHISEDALPVFLTQEEFMRRMKDMSAMGGGMMSFYGEMPDSYKFVVNTAHPLIKDMLNKAEEKCNEKVNPIAITLKEKQAEEEILKNAQKDKKSDELSTEEKDQAEAITKEVARLKKDIKDIYTAYAKENDTVKQLIDIALLASNLLKGEALAAFVKRSVNVLK